MRIHLLRIFVSLAVGCGVPRAEMSCAANPELKPAFVFRDVSYFYRWSQADEGMVKREWRRGGDGFDGMGFAFSRFASPRAALNPNLIGPIKEAQTISSKQN